MDEYPDEQHRNHSEDLGPREDRPADEAGPESEPPGRPAAPEAAGAEPAPAQARAATAGSGGLWEHLYAAIDWSGLAKEVALIPGRVPPAWRRLSEGLTGLEVKFAGVYLNLVGVFCLLVGFILFFRFISAELRGLFQVGIGTAIGLALVVFGDYYHRHRTSGLSQPLLAGGFSILFFTICAGHFFYNLFNQAVLFALILAWVIWTGYSIFKYDSKLIGNLVLITIFLSPFFMQFSLADAHRLFAYLIAANLGFAVVAYSKKWDYYSVASFLLTYVVFFHYRGAGWTVHTLAFLFLTYALFLISNHLMHFRLKTSSGYNLFVSYFNPVLFGVTSYFVLYKYPAGLAISLFALLGLIHASIMTAARRLEGEDPRFTEITRNNLILALLFLTASVSYVPYLSTTTTYFPLATALWYLIALGLLYVSWKREFYATTLRRFSYLNLLLVLVQLAAITTTMTGQVRFLVYFSAIFALTGFAWLMARHRRRFRPEDAGMFQLAVFSTLGVVVFLLWRQLPLLPNLAAYALVMFLLFALSTRGRGLLLPLRIAAYSGAAALTLALLAAAPHSPARTPFFNPDSLCMALIAICLVMSDLSLARPSIPEPDGDDPQAGHLTLAQFLAAPPEALSLLTLIVVTLLVSNQASPLPGAWKLLGLSLTFWLVFPLWLLLGPRVFRLRRLAIYVPALLAVVSLLVTNPWLGKHPAQVMVPLYGLAVLCFGASRLYQHLWPGEGERTLGPTILIWTGLLVMGRATLWLGAGQASTFLLSLAGLAALWLGVRVIRNQGLKDAGLLILFAMFLKSILYDTTAVGVAGYDLGQLGGSVFWMVAVLAVFYAAIKTLPDDPAAGRLLHVLALCIVSFQVGFLLFRVYGGLNHFQIILSAFWAGSSMIYVTSGILERSRVFRQFGLALQVATVLKILVVDIWILRHYGMLLDLTTVFLCLGAMLILTSYLYQRHRELVLQT